MLGSAATAGGRFFESSSANQQVVLVKAPPRGLVHASQQVVLGKDPPRSLVHASQQVVLGRPHLAAYAPAHEASNAAPIIQKRSRFKRSGDRCRPKETEECIHFAALSDCCALRKLLYKQVVLVKAPPRGLRRASVLQASGISQSPTARPSA